MPANRWREYIEAYRIRYEEVRSELDAMEPEDPERGELEAWLQRVEEKLRGWEQAEHRQKEEVVLRAERIRQLRAQLEALEALSGCDENRPPSPEEGEDDEC